MEKSVTSLLQDVVNMDGVTGCILSDKHGLCLASSGDVDPISSGIITAITDHISKLEPGSNPPVIRFSGDQGVILIKEGTKVNTAIFKAPTMQDES